MKYAVLFLGAVSAFRVNAAIFVDVNAAGTQDGLSWENAMTTIQPAIIAAEDLAAGEVYVAAGTYVLANAVAMRPGVNVYGGFPAGDGALSERDPIVHLTIIDGNDTTFCVEGDTGVFDGFIIQNGSAGDGAGFYCGIGETTIQNCVFRGNSAQRGGGVFVAPGITAHIDDCRFLHNRANGEGGGAIFAGPGASITVSDCRFERNISSNWGGAVFLRTDSNAASAISDSVFNGNAATVNGGGLFGLNGDISLRNSQFNANWSRDGAAFGHRTNLPPLIEKCDFDGNTAIGGNIVSIFSGSVNESVKTRVYSCNFTSNRSTAATLSCSRTALVLEDCLMRNNYGDDAGGLYFNNELRSDQLVGNGTLEIARCQFLGNTGLRTAGAGAVNAQNATVYTVTNSVFAHNTGRDGGMLLWLNTSDSQRADIVGCTFARNEGSRSGGVHLQNDRLSARPVAAVITVLWGNVGPAIGQSGIGSIQLTVDFCLLPDAASWGPTNLEQDPLFFDAADDDFRLSVPSPAIDAGTDVLDGATIPPVDVAGKPRPIGPQFDIGAHEYDPETNTDGDSLPDSGESLGDSDGNGLPDWLDPSDHPLPTGDVNVDGEVDAVDVHLTINAALGSLKSVW